MKKRSMKLLTLALVLALLFTLTLGCSQKGEDVTNQPDEDTPAVDEGTDTGTDEDTEDPEEEPAPEPEPETYDFGGRVITFACNWDAEPKPNSSAGEDRLLARIAELKEKYNVDFGYKNIPYDQFLEQYSASILAGDPMADVAYLNSSWFYPTLVTKGFLYPLSDLDGFDFSEAKWNQDIIKAATFDGKVYGFNTGKTYPAMGLFFNKAIFEREGLPDLYELQNSGQWTWEKMKEVAQQATKDTDGDGKIDQWGLGGTSLEWAFVYSNNAAVTKTIDGKETFALNEPNAIEALTEFQNFHQAYGVVEFPPEGAAWDYPIQQFQDGHTAMFAFEWYIAGRYHENMSDEYGYVMFPKGPKADDYTCVATSYGVNTIASTVKEPNQVAMVWNEYTNPFPDDDPDAWREEFENLAWDQETVDTVALMQSGKIVFSKIGAFSQLQEMMWGVIPNIKTGAKTPTVAIEEIVQQAQAAIDDVLTSNKE